MDKKLELRLIENGYKRNPLPITLKQAREYIHKMVNTIIGVANTYYSNGAYYTLEEDMILFDGMTDVIIHSGHISSPQSPAIAVTVGKNMVNSKPMPSIQIYTLQDLMEKEIEQGGSQGIPLKEGYSADIKGYDESFRIDITSPKPWSKKTNLHASVYMNPKHTQILHLERTPKGEVEQNLWKYVAEHMGIGLTNGASGCDSEINGLKLNFNYGSITVEFPRKMSKKFLSELVDGLKVLPTKIDGVEYTMDRKPHIPIGGKKLTVNVFDYNGHNGQAAISYLSRLLQKQA